MNDQPSAKPRLILEYIPDQATHLVRLYDKENHPMEDKWLFPPELVKGKTGKQLRDYFCLPYTPTFACDAVVQPEHKIYGWATPSSKRPNIFETTGGVTFSNERPIAAS